MITSGCADSPESTTSNWSTCHLSLMATEINCFALMIGGDEPESNINSCQAGEGSNYSEFTFGKLVGMFPAGSRIEIDIKPGKRRIYLLGLYNKDGVCESVTETTNGTQLQNRYSRPLLTASAELNVVNGTNTLEMTNNVLPIGSRSSQIISECRFSSPWKPSDLPAAKSNLYWLDQEGAPDSNTANNWNFNANFGLDSVKSVFQGMANFSSGGLLKITDSAGASAYSFNNNNSHMFRSGTGLNNNFAFSFVINLNEIDSESSNEKIIFKLFASSATSNSILKILSENKKLVAKTPSGSLDPSTTPVSYDTTELLNLNTGINKIMMTVIADYPNQKYLVYVNNNPTPFSVPARLFNSSNNTNTISDWVTFGTSVPTAGYYSFRGQLLADVVLYYSAVNSLYHQKMFQYYKQKYPSYLP
jgi:hypothetical protein